MLVPDATASAPSRAPRALLNPNGDKDRDERREMTDTDIFDLPAGQGVYFAKSGNFAYSGQQLYAARTAEGTQRCVICELISALGFSKTILGSMIVRVCT